MSLKQQLLDAELGLTQSDFDSHESDLYVLERPDGQSVRNWLINNYEHANNVTEFHGALGTGWWDGKLAYDIPFAA